MDNAELVKQLTVLQDIEAIKQLKAEYCDVCDDDHNQDRIVTLFAEDGIWEGQGIGRAQGRADIRKLFKSFAERISFSQHNVFNPRIEVHSDKAYGRWNLLGPFTFRAGNHQLLDEVELPPDRYTANKVLRNLARVLLHAGNTAGGKGAIDELAHPCVRRRVAADKSRRLRREGVAVSSNGGKEK